MVPNVALAHAAQVLLEACTVAGAAEWSIALALALENSLLLAGKAAYHMNELSPVLPLSMWFISTAMPYTISTLVRMGLVFRHSGHVGYFAKRRVTVLCRVARRNLTGQHGVRMQICGRATQNCGRSSAFWQGRMPAQARTGTQSLRWIRSCLPRWTPRCKRSIWMSPLLPPHPCSM